MELTPFALLDTDGCYVATYFTTPEDMAGRTDCTPVLPPEKEYYQRCRWNGSEWLIESVAGQIEAQATGAQVQSLLETYEVAPIEIFGSVIDCDDRSEKLMRDALASWDVRELDGEWFRTEYNGDEHIRVLRWKLTDNTLVQFTKEQLMLVYNQMLLARAARGQRLWIRAQQYKTNPPLLADIDTIEKFLEGA